MLTRGPVRFLSIDLFRTLIYPKPGLPKIYSDFGKLLFNFDFDEANVSKAFMEAYAAAEHRWPNFGSVNKISASEWWREVIIRTFQNSSSISKADVRRILTVERANEIYDWFAGSSPWALMPGTLRGLDKLADMGLYMCILSNSDERTPKIVKNLNIDQYFKFIFFSASSAYMKPDKRIFHCVAERFGQTTGENLDLETCLRHYAHVGDSGVRDYWGAVQAGCGGGAFLFKPQLGNHGRQSSAHANAATTDWAYTEPDQPTVPPCNIVSSLLELANRLEVQNHLSRGS